MRNRIRNPRHVNLILVLDYLARAQVLRRQPVHPLERHAIPPLFAHVRGPLWIVGNVSMQTVMGVVVYRPVNQLQVDLGQVEGSLL